MMISQDEIVSIEYIGEQDTIDINVSGNRLFWANDILTHNSATDEVEFDHSHISGGLSKIQTADNVFGIFTSRQMRENGKYQIQMMKTRSSSGVGKKIDLDFNIDTLRITDSSSSGDDDDQSSSTSAKYGGIINSLQRSSKIEDTAPPTKASKAQIESSKLRTLINNLSTDIDFDD